MADTCEKCSYWNPVTEIYGECRAHAPSAYSQVDAARTIAVWIKTRTDDWCGEFKSKGGPPITEGSR